MCSLPSDVNHKVEYIQIFSLFQNDIISFKELIQTGSTMFSIPESFFETLYPGCYERKLLSIQLIISVIVGPYTNIKTKLTLLKNYVRQNVSKTSGDLIEMELPHQVFVSLNNPNEFLIQAFEGMGAISDWKLDVSETIEKYKLKVINDVILEIKYNAKHNSI